MSVYFFTVNSRPNAVKIGYTANISSRSSEWSGRLGEDVYVFLLFTGGYELESYFHSVFSNQRMVSDPVFGDEWFFIDGELRDFLALGYGEQLRSIPRKLMREPRTVSRKKSKKKKDSLSSFETHHGIRALNEDTAPPKRPFRFLSEDELAWENLHGAIPQSVMRRIGEREWVLRFLEQFGDDEGVDFVRSQVRKVDKPKEFAVYTLRSGWFSMTVEEFLKENSDTFDYIKRAGHKVYLSVPDGVYSLRVVNRHGVTVRSKKASDFNNDIKAMIESVFFEYKLGEV